LATEAIKHHRFRFSARAQGSAVGALGLLRIHGLGTPDDLLLGQFPRYHISNLAGQLLQIEERSRFRKFLLVLPRQRFHHRLHLGF